MSLNVIRIKHLHYIHVLDSNTNVTRVEIGPQTFTRQEHEKIVFGPEEMIKIPPRHYVVISNPVVRNEKGEAVTDATKNARLKFGEEEIRFDKEPFPLYPGESLVGKVTPLTIVAPNTALHLKALRDITDGTVEKKAGDEWLFPGPATYIPRVEVQVLEVQRATVIKENQALKLRARHAHTGTDGKKRLAGEEWLLRDAGAFLPDVEEEVIETVKAYVLTEKKALQLRAIRTFTDVYKIERKAGEEWLVTINLAETHIPDVYEEVVGEVKITALSNRQYCVILDPVGKNGKPRFGQRELRRGEVSFFLLPGERLENGIQNVHILGEEEALLLKAKEACKDEKGLDQLPGFRWMIFGPRDYVPPVQVEIIEKRKKIPLDENEGIYVRDIKTGKVSVKKGESYLLQAHEELWEKELPKAAEELLSKAGQERGTHGALATTSTRDKSRVVTYRAPHNSSVQIYDYRNKRSRVIFGPELVMLDPDEHFTVLSLSGNKPKKPNVIKSLCLFLGPDFMTDVVTVETSDHARLALQLAYNWYFQVNKATPDKMFSVPDFVGAACKTIASRVRGAVASCTFDNFHRHSADIIRSAVFGKGSDGEIREEFSFDPNGLVITAVDIQSVEPVDQRTRDSLQKSVQLAIEITTKSQEANARHEAERVEQEARGRLERQKIKDEAHAEKTKKELLQLQAQSAAVESTGQATAEAQARAEAALIEGEAAVTQAKLKAEATTIKSEADLQQIKIKQNAKIEHEKKVTELEIEKSRRLAAIESKKFAEVVSTIGPDTIKTIAEAGPEMQAKLLQGLGLKSFLITDGNSPINLFNTAQGLLGGVPSS